MIVILLYIILYLCLFVFLWFCGKWFTEMRGVFNNEYNEAKKADKI